jgi:hypothetical protein
MATDVALKTSPATALESMRGRIVDAQLGYPGVLHIAILDSESRVWRLVTQDAEWTPKDPSELVDRSVEGSELDASTAILRLELSDGGVLEIRPGARESETDPPYWEILTPYKQILEFGPGLHWQINEADRPKPSPS